MPRIPTLLASLFLLLFAASAGAQDVRLEPRAIVVNPSPSFGVTVWVDKSGEAPSYRVGEEIEVGVRVDRDAYVYLFSLQPDGSVTQILPNRFSDDNYVRAGESRTFPPSGAGFVFNTEPPTGLSKVVAVASARELDTRELARFQSGDAPFATSNIGQEGFQSAFRIVVNPVPQGDWVTATAYYEVTRGGSSSGGNAAQATLAIDSDPRDAEVYLDGSYQGSTPLRVQANPGRRTVRIQRDGYVTFETTIQLSPRESRRIDADLDRVRRTGTLRFETNPSGATVFVDGGRVGTTPIGTTTFDAGSHDVRIELPGYVTDSFRVSVDAGSSGVVRRDLRGLTGSLRVQANVGGARAFLNGRSIGTVANGSGRLDADELDPRWYELTLVAPGYETEVESVRIETGERTDIRIRMERH